MKKRVLVGVGAAAVAAVLLWPRDAKRETPPERAAKTEPEPAARRKAHPRPEIDEPMRARIAALGHLIEATQHANQMREDAAPFRVDETLQTAKALFEIASGAFEKHDYADAAEAFLTAYDSVPYPDFLYNAALSYEKLGNCAAALEYYPRYLEEKENPRDAPAVAEKIALLRQTCGR